ncbi:unnamed protein product, partial [Rotaria sp. Silwood2]
MKSSSIIVPIGVTSEKRDGIDLFSGLIINESTSGK